ncbi:MAG TPA: MMPL family transporter, partial [Gaiellaceae bacterium]|nr:MMPL family transporter [Gaiellaceae bacterium]
MLVRSSSETVADPGFRAVVRDVLAAVEGKSAVKAVRSPLDPAHTGLVSHGGHAALVQFDLRGDATKAQDHVQPFLDATAAVQAKHPGFTVGEFGEASANHVLSKTLDNDFKRAEYSSLPVTLVILFFAFGALLAAGLPVLLAFSGVLATIGLSSLASHLFAAGDPIFTSMGLATEIVVLLAMVGSVTVLPALLHALGDRV